MRDAVGIVLGVLFALSIAFQAYQLYKFVNAGERFTADDGRAMGERIAALERRIAAVEQFCGRRDE